MFGQPYTGPFVTASLETRACELKANRNQLRSQIPLLGQRRGASSLIRPPRQLDSRLLEPVYRLDLVGKLIAFNAMRPKLRPGQISTHCSYTFAWPDSHCCNWLRVSPCKHDNSVLSTVSAPFCFEPSPKHLTTLCQDDMLSEPRWQAGLRGDGGLGDDRQAPRRMKLSPRREPRRWAMGL